MKRKQHQKEDGGDESNRGCEHAAAKPDCISLHLMRNHLHVDRLRLWEEKFQWKCVRIAQTSSSPSLSHYMYVHTKSLKNTSTIAYIQDSCITGTVGAQHSTDDSLQLVDLDSPRQLALSPLHSKTTPANSIWMAPVLNGGSQPHKRSQKGFDKYGESQLGQIKSRWLVKTNFDMQKCFMGIGISFSIIIHTWHDIDNTNHCIASCIAADNDIWQYKSKSTSPFDQWWPQLNLAYCQQSFEGLVQAFAQSPWQVECKDHSTTGWKGLGSQIITCLKQH